MLDYNYIKEQMREIFALTQPKGIFKTPRFDNFLYEKFFSNYIKNSKEISTTFNAETMVTNLKENVNSKRYQMLKIESENTNYSNFTIYFKEPMSTSKHTIGGLVTVELEDNKATVTTFQLYNLIKLYNSEEVIESFEKYIEGTTVEEVKEKETKEYEEKEKMELEELNKNISVQFPLDPKLYMADDYIHPSISFKLNLIKEDNRNKYEDARRSVINNNKRMNRTNSYHRELIGTNKYHEMEFPVVGIRPNLEEFTDEHVWDDEKIYYKSRAREYIPFDIPDHYVSTSARFGSVNIGNISKISGKKDAGWGAIQKGEFYITERQLIIFDKGPSKLNSFLNLALNADTYKRSVYWFTWPEIDYVEGNIKEGTLLISTSQDKHKQHKFTKINESNQNIGFTEDELRYLVNLIGSLIEKSLY